MKVELERQVRVHGSGADVTNTLGRWCQSQGYTVTAENLAVFATRGSKLKSLVTSRLSRVFREFVAKVSPADEGVWVQFALRVDAPLWSDRPDRIELLESELNELEDELWSVHRVPEGGLEPGRSCDVHQRAVVAKCLLCESDCCAGCMATESSCQPCYMNGRSSQIRQ